MGQTELLVILFILLLLFGSTKLPELARSMGRAKKEFKDGMKEDETSPPAAEPPKPEPQPVQPAQPAQPAPAEPAQAEPKPEAPVEEKKPATTE
ncbi:MAG: twin-arginine translocase TatA/TatE family subunit [Candidatus Hydrothermarchaeales archaeon]